jgi:hypothetical protein
MDAVANAAINVLPGVVGTSIGNITIQTQLQLSSPLSIPAGHSGMKSMLISIPAQQNEGRRSDICWVDPAVPPLLGEVLCESGRTVGEEIYGGIDQCRKAQPA